MSYFTIDATTPSKNYSSRNGTAIRMLVIHATAGSYASALAELTDPKPQAPDRRVSAHYLISKTGHIAQLVPDAQAAWHAGVSTWRGLNSLEIQACSLGVELENANTGSDPYPPIQIDALLWLSRILVAQYSIVQDMTVRHLDIAPKRKTDPAGFPWATFTAALFAPMTKRYRVKRVMISQRQEGGPPYAGELAPGDEVVADKWYSNNKVHLQDGRGFVDLADLEAV